MKRTKKIFENILEFEAREDGGQAIISSIHEGTETGTMFVRVQSWDETLAHEEIKKYLGKKVRITLEVIE